MTDLFQISLYHITHIDNLSRILMEGDLWCDCERLRRCLNSISIAYSKLKERRMKTSVPLYPPKTLGDFVPFYFAKRSPMLYAIHTGFVGEYKGGQESIIYLVGSVGKIITCQKKWCFTDGHAVETFSDFYNELNHLDKLDWDIIGSRSWNNRDDDNDRKRRKQAEFLVESFVPLLFISGIGVINQKMQSRVQQLVNSQENSPVVSIEPDWYY